MEISKIEQFMLLNAGNFSESDLVKIQNKLESVPEEYATLVLGTEFKKPTTLSYHSWAVDLVLTVFI